MTASFQTSVILPEFGLWKKIRDKRYLAMFTVELTARCNNNCRHCYINLPAFDRGAMRKELSFGEIRDIADEAVSLGAIWCLITGGEPLLREDFFDIYLYLKKKGLLITVFTNGTLLTHDHVQLFKKYPPRDLEVSVYGSKRNTYERISRKLGSFDAFIKGLYLLRDGGINFRLKTMALRSNVSDIMKIEEFSKKYTKEPFRYDPMLKMRHDFDRLRNEEIRSERLNPLDIARLEQEDPDRLEAWQKYCETRFRPDLENRTSRRLFYCAAGNRSFDLTHDGYFRLCSSLCHPSCVYDLRKGSLTDAWTYFVPRVRELTSERNEFLDNCRSCALTNLCYWCPAHAHLESGKLDGWIEYFCEIAHQRTKTSIFPKNK